MMAQARKLGLPLRELTSDLAVSAVLNNNDDNDDDDGNKKSNSNSSSGYFYAEIPTRGGKQDYKKFLYQENSSTDSNIRVTVPLQFGREVLAAVLRKPELAHWKSCLVEPEKEAAMATDFRKSFAEIK
jgi:Protein similar to CwfJ C-terminus 2